MHVAYSLLFTACLASILTGRSACATEYDQIFQFSTLQALLDGIYDGDLTFRELARHGDFGIGTLNGLDGEMIGLDGEFYQIRANGRVYPVTATQKTPFAEVTFFQADKTRRLKKTLTYGQLTAYLDGLLPSANLLYALKIEGFFPYVKARSMSRQHRPYPPLLEVARTESMFEFTGVKGVIVAFHYPRYLAGLNLTGYHCHFITADRQHGGHLLDCRVEQATVAVDIIPNFFLHLPESRKFLHMDLTQERQDELAKAER
jgi:acetolactate decarboxylase